jgi:cysteine desulfurase
MAESLRLFQLNSRDGIDAIGQMRDELQQRIERDCAPVVVHGKAVDRLPNTLSVAFPGLEGEAMLVNFNMEGIACSLGSTCASGSAEPAPALLAMGVPDDVCMASVRFSLSCQTTQNEVRMAADRIARVVNRMRCAAS